jgi:hypothetical protein
MNVLGLGLVWSGLGKYLESAILGCLFSSSSFFLLLGHWELL